MEQTPAPVDAWFLVYLPLWTIWKYFFDIFWMIIPNIRKDQWWMACPLFIGFLHLFLASKLVRDFFRAEYDVEIQFPACSSFHWRSASMPGTKANLDGLQIDWQWSAKSHSFAYCLGEERAFVGNSLRWFELGSSFTKILWDIPWTSYPLLIHSLVICSSKSTSRYRFGIDSMGATSTQSMRFTNLKDCILGIEATWQGKISQENRPVYQ